MVTNLEAFLEALEFGAQLADDACARVLVDDGVADDALGAVGVAQRRERLLVVVRRRRHRRHHHRPAVAAQIVLKNIVHDDRVPLNTFLYNRLHLAAISRVW